MKLKTDGTAIFQETTVPGGTRLVGLAALVQALAVNGPLRQPCCVSEQHVRGSRREQNIWIVFDKRYWPGDTFADHLSGRQEISVAIETFLP